MDEPISELGLKEVKIPEIPLEPVTVKLESKMELNILDVSPDQMQEFQSKDDFCCKTVAYGTPCFVQENGLLFRVTEAVHLIPITSD